MKTLTFMLFCTLCSFGTMAQQGYGKVKELKIHSNSRELSPSRMGNRHERIETRKNDTEFIKSRQERPHRPHFEKLDKSKNEHREKNTKERKERKERKDLREHKSK